MAEDKLTEYSFFEKRTVVVIAKTEKEAWAIANAGGGERGPGIVHEVYCETSANDDAEPTTLSERDCTLEEEIETYRRALQRIVEIFEDREAFVMMGPRAFIQAELIAKSALE